jgi:hypothetical protein
MQATSNLSLISPFECAVQFDSLTKKQKRIVTAFLWFYEKRLIGHHDHTRPTIEFIQKMAGCVRSTVCKFLKECFDWFFVSIRQEKNPFEKTFYHNVYEFQTVMFDFLLKIKHMGFLTNWQKHRLKVLDMFCTDKQTAREKTSQIVHEKHQKIGHGSAQNSDPNKDLKKDLNTYKKSVSISDENRKKAYGILRDEGLSHEEAMKISKFYSFDAVFEARKEAHWYRKFKPIQNLPAYFWARCKVYLKK